MMTNVLILGGTLLAVLLATRIFIWAYGPLSLVWPLVAGVLTYILLSLAGHLYYPMLVFPLAHSLGVEGQTLLLIDRGPLGAIVEEGARFLVLLIAIGSRKETAIATAIRFGFAYGCAEFAIVNLDDVLTFGLGWGASSWSPDLILIILARSAMIFWHVALCWCLGQSIRVSWPLYLTFAIILHTGLNIGSVLVELNSSYAWLPVYTFLAAVTVLKFVQALCEPPAQLPFARSTVEQNVDRGKAISTAFPVAANNGSIAEKNDDEAAPPPTAIEQVLRDLITATPDLDGATIVTSGGLVVASALAPTVNVDLVSAMTATLFSLGERTAEKLGRGRLEQVCVKGDQGYVMLMNAGADNILEVIAGQNAKLGTVLFEMQRTAAQLSIAQSHLTAASDMSSPEVEDRSG